MARPRKATNVLQLNGAFAKNPDRGRERENEPEPKAGIGPCPATFEADEVQAWDYLVGIMPVGVLGDCDRAHLEVAAKLFAYSRRVKVEEWLAANITRLDAMLGKMGLNPADRSKVKAAKVAPKNSFLDL
jgi:hypothetical protein